MLAEFLSSLKDELLQDLLQLKQVKNNEEKVAVLIAQIGLIGIIKDLPLVVKDLKFRVDEHNKKPEAIRMSQED